MCDLAFYYSITRCILTRVLAGFGLGALNEADDDDLDVYDSSLPAERTYMPYDAADRETDENISLSGSKGRTPQVQARSVSSCVSTVYAMKLTIHTV